MPSIYHAHFYFDHSCVEIARSIYAKAKNLPNTELGKFHERSVGPHINWSFMVLFFKENHNEVTSWVNENRQGLSVLIHPETGNDLIDHTENAVWIGNKAQLDLSSF